MCGAWIHSNQLDDPSEGHRQATNENHEVGLIDRLTVLQLDQRRCDWLDWMSLLSLIQPDPHGGGVAVATSCRSVGG